jgi:REP element-mobilizing transposase RayT
VRQQFPKAFSRNYGLVSVGSARRDLIEHYVETQLNHHRMADPRVQTALFEQQFVGNSELSIPRMNSHAQFVYNLHVVLVNAEHLNDLRQEVLGRRREMILSASQRKGHLLSRVAILTDHVHLMLGCQLNESPAEIALAYMNNLAYVEGMEPVYQFGYYVGTFGEYDLQAIRNRIRLR